ncbi:hypothetical protein [Cardiobacterium hominis]|uniref:hypothetical protein n=1 Tax=Cardiobacterium hominis TaxID=2718 RepID=UPI0028E978F3|nr:hypothetical protein [Cardiobacterium hominis]
MNALLGLTAPRRLSAVRPQGTAPELKFAAACFVSLLLLLLIWLGRGGAVGKILMSIALLAIVAFLYRLFAKPKLDPVYGKILRARIPEAVWKDRMLRDFTLSDKQKAALGEALRDWLIIRRQCDAPLAQPSLYVEQLWLALHNQPGWLQAVGERPAPSTSLCTSRNGMLIWAYACALQGVEPGKPAFLPRLWCVDLLLDKGEFAEAAAQAKLQHWAAAYQEAQTRRY